MPLERMISSDYGEERRASIDMTRATPSTDIGPGLGRPQREHETTHLSVVDAEGNAVAITTTINSFYGSKVTVQGAGFLLNNEMDDFAAQPGQPNQFGLVQGENNAIESGKRMLSAGGPKPAPPAIVSLIMSPGSRTVRPFLGKAVPSGSIFTAPDRDPGRPPWRPSGGKSHLSDIIESSDL